MKTVEKDPYGGWIARDPQGCAIYDEDWRWNSRSVARSVAREYRDYPRPVAAIATPVSDGEMG